jgi:flagellar FliJ protein
MAFRFSLESVLHLRESVERSEELVLQQISQEIGRVESEIQTLETMQGSLREKRDHDLSQGMHASHLQEWNEQEARIVISIRNFREQLRQLEISKRKQLAILQSARLDRELLSKLREGRHRSYKREQLRQEQKMLDDLFLAQLIAKR